MSERGNERIRTRASVKDLALSVKNDRSNALHKTFAANTPGEVQVAREVYREIDNERAEAEQSSDYARANKLGATLLLLAEFIVTAIIVATAL